MRTVRIAAAVLIGVTLAGAGRTGAQEPGRPDAGGGGETSSGGGFALFPREAECNLEFRGADRVKPETAHRLIRGQKLDYGVWVDRSNWIPMWSPEEGGDLAFVPEGGGDFGAFTEAQIGAIPFQKMADGFVAAMTKNQTDLEVETREIRRINGNDFLCVELSGQWKGQSVRTLGCFFSNDEESIAFIGYEPQAVFEKGEHRLEGLADGMVLRPSPSDGWPEKVPFEAAPRAKTSSPMRVDPAAGVDPPIVSERVEPVYPEEARKSREAGVAILEGIISAEGCVEDLRVLKATREPLLDDAAMRAVRQWTYQPALFEGKPVSVYLTITVNFQLH